MVEIEKIKGVLLGLIEKNFAINKEIITEETKIEDLDIDKFSTDFVDLLMLIEKEFEINIENDEFINSEKISDLINLIRLAIEKKEKEQSKKQ